MGVMVSMCGLGPGKDHSDPHLEYLRDDSNITTSERSRAQSGGTDTSVASILSNVDSLIPDVFQPVDIQVLSRGRRRSGVHQSGGTTPSKSTSQTSLHNTSGATLALQRHALLNGESYGAQSNLSGTVAERER